MTPEQIVAAADRVGEVAEAEAYEADRNAGFSERVRDAIAEGQINLLLRPKRYGGFGFGPQVFSDMVEAVARHNVAAAWLTYFVALHEQWVAFLPPEGREEIFSSGGFVADIFFPIGKVEYVEGGVRLSGRWNWGSGIEWDEWVGLGALVEVPGFEEYGAQPSLVTVRTEEAEIIRNWDPFGLRGTGSQAVAVDDVFVPWRRVLPLVTVKNTGVPIGGDYDPDEPIYREPFFPSFCLGFGAICKGATARLREELRERIRGRQRVVLGMQEWESPIAQRNLAEVSVWVDEVAAMHQRYIDQLEAWVAAGTPVAPAEDINRLNAWRAEIARKAARVGFRCMELLGGAATYKGDIFELFSRDLFMISLHVTQIYEDAMHFYGRTQFGLDGHPLT